MSHRSGLRRAGRAFGWAPAARQLLLCICRRHFLPSCFRPRCRCAGRTATMTLVQTSSALHRCATRISRSIAHRACDNRVARPCVEQRKSVWPYGNSRGMSSQAVDVQPHPYEETAKMVKSLSHPDPLVSRYVSTNCSEVHTHTWPMILQESDM